MKSFFTSIPALCLGASFLTTLSTQAEIFILKDGTRLKGKIVSQTYEHYNLKVEIVENVLSDKQIPVSEVVKIVRDDKSLKAFNKIQALFPIKEGLTLEYYDKIKIDHFQPFYINYPRSKNTDAVKKLEDKLNAEYENLKNGGIKLDEKLISKEEFEANQYEYEAALKLNKLKDHISKQRLIPALRTFEEMEKSYSQTKFFKEAITEVNTILPTFTASLAKMKGNVENERKKKERYLEGIEASDKTRVMSAVDKKHSQYEKQLDNAMQVLKTKWLPVNKYEMEPISKVLTIAESEQERLEKLSSVTHPDAGQLYRELFKSIKRVDYKAAQTTMAEFKKAKPPAHTVTMLDKKIKEIELASMAAEERAAQEKALKLQAEKKAQKEAEKAAAALAKSKKPKDTSFGQKIRDKNNLIKEAEELK